MIFMHVNHHEDLRNDKKDEFGMRAKNCHNYA